MRDRIAVKLNVAVVSYDESNHHVEGRGFAGAVWPKETNNLARLDGKIDSFDDLTRAVALLQALGFERMDDWTGFRCGLNHVDSLRQ